MSGTRVGTIYPSDEGTDERSLLNDSYYNPVLIEEQSRIKLWFEGRGIGEGRRILPQVDSYNGHRFVWYHVEGYQSGMRAVLINPFRSTKLIVMRFAPQVPGASIANAVLSEIRTKNLEGPSFERVLQINTTGGISNCKYSCRINNEDVPLGYGDPVNLEDYFASRLLGEDYTKMARHLRDDSTLTVTASGFYSDAVTKVRDALGLVVPMSDK